MTGWVCVESGEPGRWVAQGGGGPNASSALASECERGLQLLEASHEMETGAAKDRVIANANRLMGLQ